jgi:hypothetical protein
MDAPNVVTQIVTMKNVHSKEHSVKYYIILEKVVHDVYYDLAYVHVGLVEDQQGIMLKIPVPQSVNNDWLDKYLTKQVNKLIGYIEQNLEIKE